MYYRIVMRHINHMKSHSVIDTDIHITLNPKRVCEFLPECWKARWNRGDRGPSGAGYHNSTHVFRRDAVTPEGNRIEACPRALAQYYFDEYKIEYGVLNTSNLTQLLSPDPDYSAALASAINEVLIEDWASSDPRFKVSILVSAVDPILAAKEIRRAGHRPGVIQVLMPLASQLPYGQRFYHPIYEAAEEMGLPVATHPGNEGSGITGAPTGPGYPSRYLEWHSGLPTYGIAQLLSLITEGVFSKYKKLRFVLTEAGVAWIVPILWRLDKNWKGLRKTTPWLDRLPSEIARDHLLLTTQPIEEPDNKNHLFQMLEMFDAGNMLMFASDYPHWDNDMPDFAARFIPEHLRARVMSETARKLYKLPVRENSVVMESRVVS